MAKFGKIIGAGLGWAFGGPLGALFGVAIGAMFDKMDTGTYSEENYKEKYNGYRHRSSREDFNRALIALTASVMKADGRVLVSELNYVKRFFNQSFGQERASEYLLILKEILKSDIPVEEVCQQIEYFMEEPAKLQLLHYLFGLGLSDGDLDNNEVDLIHQIAIWLGIREPDFRSIYSMFAHGGGGAHNHRSSYTTHSRPIQADFEILEIGEEASDQEIKRAYRTMAKKHHPDRVAHLGEDHVQGAKEKFQKVQEAYDRICKERNIV